MSFPKRASFIISSVIFAVLSVFAVFLRIYSRHLSEAKLNWSDALAVLALVALLASTAMAIVMIHSGGAGLHMTELTPEQIVLLLKLFFSATFTWAIAMTSIKMSILSFYRAAFMITTTVYLVGIVTFLNTIAALLIAILSCRPIQYNWDKFNYTGSCINEKPLLMAVAVVNCVLDIVIFCMPLPRLWKLQMPKQRKWSITIIFSVGVVVCVMSALRIMGLVHLDLNDYSYTVTEDLLYALLELGLGLINSCMPFYKPLMKKLFSENSNVPPRFGRKKNNWQELSFYHFNDSAQIHPTTTAVATTFPRKFAAGELRSDTELDQIMVSQSIHWTAEDKSSKTFRRDLL